MRLLYVSLHLPLVKADKIIYRDVWVAQSVKGLPLAQGACFSLSFLFLLSLAVSLANK